MTKAALTVVPVTLPAKSPSLPIPQQTVSALAREFNVSRQTIRRWRAKGWQPPAATVIEILPQHQLVAHPWPERWPRSGRSPDCCVHRHCRACARDQCAIRPWPRHHSARSGHLRRTCRRCGCIGHIPARCGQSAVALSPPRARARCVGGVVRGRWLGGAGISWFRRDEHQRHRGGTKSARHRRCGLH
jgi:hypothetical protein